MIPASISQASELAHQSDLILMCLASSRDPAQSIMRKYDEAKDKDLFVLALIGTLILRHKQWQAQPKQ